jgi:hypothetical protein
MGKNNPLSKDNIAKADKRITLPTTNVKKDPGIVLSSDMKWKTQVDYATCEANRMLSFL